jgi:hypothetical protein
MANLFLSELSKNSSSEIADLIETVDFHFIPTMNPGLNFTNILRAAFLNKSQMSNFSVLAV